MTEQDGMAFSSEPVKVNISVAREPYEDIPFLSAPVKIPLPASCRGFAPDAAFENPDSPQAGGAWSVECQPDFSAHGVPPGSGDDLSQAFADVYTAWEASAPTQETFEPEVPAPKCNSFPDCRWHTSANSVGTVSEDGHVFTKSGCGNKKVIMSNR